MEMNKFNLTYWDGDAQQHNYFETDAIIKEVFL